MSTDEKTPQTSSGTSFLVFLLCALALSFAFMNWFSRSNTSLNNAYGGLPVGEPAPELVADVWVKGNAPEPEELEGNVYVVVAWATWCYPCYLEAPHLVKAYQEFKDDNVRFIGLTAEPAEAEEQILAWLDDRDITWPNGFGLAAATTLEEYHADYIPAVWVIGRDGKVWWNRGMSESESLEEALRRTLEKS